MGRCLTSVALLGALPCSSNDGQRPCWASLVVPKGRGCQRLSMNGFSTFQSTLPHLETKLSVVSPFL